MQGLATTLCRTEQAGACQRATATLKQHQGGVSNIDLANHNITTEEGETIYYDRLISTISFPSLLQKAGVEYDGNIYNWNQVLVFNLGFDTKGKDVTSHWIYFPESKYCFYRVGFYSNILSTDKMSLYVEIGFKKGDITCNTDTIGTK